MCAVGTAAVAYTFLPAAVAAQYPAAARITLEASDGDGAPDGVERSAGAGFLPGWTCDAAVNATNAPGDILDFVDPARGGNIAAGQALPDSSCSFCHAAGSHDPDAEVANDLAGTGDNVIPALGSIDAAMSSVTLTQQEVDDLKAFLNSL